MSLADGQRCELLTGRDWFGEGFGEDEEARRAAWEANRDELLAYWLQESWTRTPGAGPIREPQPGGPGGRPWAWWRYEAPEPRREVTRCGLKPCEVTGYSLGIPLAYRDPGYDPDNPPRYEDETLYLARHGLLTDAERDWLNRDDLPRAPVLPFPGGPRGE